MEKERSVFIIEMQNGDRHNLIADTGLFDAQQGRCKNTPLGCTEAAI